MVVVWLLRPVTAWLEQPLLSKMTLGIWTLIGATVAPAFLFEKFEMAPPGWEPG